MTVMDGIRRRFAETGRLEYDDAKHVLDQNRRYANRLATVTKQVQEIIDRAVVEARKPRTLGDLSASHIGSRIRVGRFGETLMRVEFVRHMDGDTVFAYTVGPLSSATTCEVIEK